MDPKKLIAPIVTDAALYVRGPLRVAICAAAMAGDCMRSAKASGTDADMVREVFDGSEARAVAHAQLIGALEQMIRDGYGLVSAIDHLIRAGWISRLEGIEKGRE